MSLVRAKTTTPPKPKMANRTTISDWIMKWNDMTIRLGIYSIALTGFRDVSCATSFQTAQSTKTIPSEDWRPEGWIYDPNWYYVQVILFSFVKLEIYKFATRSKGTALWWRQGVFSAGWRHGEETWFPLCLSAFIIYYVAFSLHQFMCCVYQWLMTTWTQTSGKYNVVKWYWWLHNFMRAV